MNGPSFFLMLSCISFPVLAQSTLSLRIHEIYKFLLEENGIPEKSPTVLDILDPNKGVECLKPPKPIPLFNNYSLFCGITEKQENFFTPDNLKNGKLANMMQKLIDGRKPEHAISIARLNKRLSTVTTEPSLEDQTLAIQKATSLFVQTMYSRLSKHNQHAQTSRFIGIAYRVNNQWY